MEELLQATDKFSDDNKIGLGSFGSVYYGILADGQEVAIKRDFASNSGNWSLNRQAFVAELRVLSHIKHKNLVRLFGFLEEKNERALVYEYLSNRSLHDHLHGQKDQYSNSPLKSWIGRLKVALDAAQGIEYLHFGGIARVLHRDVKSSNILLDSDFTAKVADFGLSVLADKDDDLITVRAAGTVGYLDPDYYRSGHVTAKSDVYAFGVVLLELLSGKRAIHRGENGTPCNLIDSAVPFIVNGEITRILDPKLLNPSPLEMEAVTVLAFLAVDCVDLDAQNRPPMTEVVSQIKAAINMCFVTK